jgi:hypothetical protein
MNGSTHFRNGRLLVNGEARTTATGNLEDDLLSAWLSSGLEQPRFHRMDRSSKLLALATAPFFAPGGALYSLEKDRIGSVICGRSGSMDTDVGYDDQLRSEGHAGPGLFVYTLPNIAMGELTIMHGLHGSGLCLLSERPDPEQMRLACKVLIDFHGMEVVVCGWSDIFADQAAATFILVTKAYLDSCNNHELQVLFNEY